MTTEILMVRHGQSVWNAQGRWQGQADPPLSDLGREQADAAGDFVAAQTGFGGIATSTLDRAATTGSIIAQKAGFDEPYRCADLAERSAGEWSGLTRAEIDERYPGYLKNRKYPPGYEHDAELLVRIRRGLHEVVEKLSGGRLLIVAHGGLIYSIETSLGLPFRHMSNLGGRWFGFNGAGEFKLGARIDLLAAFDGETTTPTAI